MQTLRGLIAGDDIGALVGVSASRAAYKPDAYFAVAPWRTQEGGGPVLINLIHEIDFLRFTAGEIVAVSAIASNRQRHFDVEGTAGAVPEFPNLVRWKQEPGERGWNQPVPAQRLFATTIDPYVAQRDHFRDVIRGTATSLQSVDDGAHQLIATLAVTEAARRKTRIELRPRYENLAARNPSSKETIMTKKPIYVLNGTNLNLLGEREPHIYGYTALADIKARCHETSAAAARSLVFRQSIMRAR